MRATHRVVDGPARVIRSRVAEIADGERIGSAVRNAVDVVRNVVVMAARLSLAGWSPVAFSAATGASGGQPST